MEAGHKAGYLEEFGVTSVLSADMMPRIWGGDQESAEDRPDLALQKWLQQLPDVIMSQINLALQQESPFMPPDVTPEMMAESNSSVPSMNHIEILYRCLDLAMRAKDYKIAAAIIYVVDRACYRFGRSGALLNVVDEIMQVSPETPIAPQVVLRKARVLKDTGDLHGSMKILDAVISKECKWEYKDNIQYENTKAVCVQIKGQILHNLGLWKEAITPLVDSVDSFKLVRDNKGISSSLGLLSRCLRKLSYDDFINLRIMYPVHVSK
ncbi:alpha-protein kinase 1-like [Pomacea canaliculata]|uniref:alpha-protein kinase 1-like n=1 Tax=Pomacea canaliculata TaxID=400727 RepID=UPI000D73B6BB|nr:alpha-protein kinase 1-like [Pomacea canaliculata]